MRAPFFSVLMFAHAFITTLQMKTKLYNMSVPYIRIITRGMKTKLYNMSVPYIRIITRGSKQCWHWFRFRLLCCLFSVECAKKAKFPQAKFRFAMLKF